MKTLCIIHTAVWNNYLHYLRTSFLYILNAFLSSSLELLLLLYYLENSSSSKASFSMQKVLHILTPNIQCWEIIIVSDTRCLVNRNVPYFGYYMLGVKNYWQFLTWSVQCEELYTFLDTINLVARKVCKKLYYMQNLLAILCIWKKVLWKMIIK